MKNRDSLLGAVRVLDGGFASELERQGACLDGPLWSARVLEEEPERVVAVHRAYLQAGAECLLTASYQVSRQGYAEAGLDPARADRALLQAVALARRAVAETPEKTALVAASLGPYGAALHNGAEYHGRYACSFAELVQFHRERIAVLAEARNEERPDLLAFETLPSLEEAQAIAQAIAPWPELAVWFSFTCRDGRHTAHGERLADCVAAVSALPQSVAVGVNCTAPEWIPELIAAMRSATRLPIVVYPNSGEIWQADERRWSGEALRQGFGAMAAGWYAAGAQIVGGCCRTRPEDIRQAAQTARGQQGR